MGSAILMEIPIAMILACRLLPLRANRLANIIAGGVMTFVMPLVTGDGPPAYPEYLFFATIKTVCTLSIIWQAWTWSGVEMRIATLKDTVKTTAWRGLSRQRKRPKGPEADPV